MFENSFRKRLSGTFLVAALSMLLTGCFVTPGKFDSKLVLGKDNSFSFSYSGEVFFLGLSQMAMMGGAEDQGEFSANQCYDDETFDERDCTEEEIADQKAEWDAAGEMRRAQNEKQAKQMAAMLGGTDPNDPEAGQLLAAKIERQRGWEKVEYVGNGVFNVEFAISGTLSHDLSFPVIENVPVPTPFVQVIMRKGNQVRVNAPSFAASENGSAMSTGVMGMMSGLGQAMAQDSNDGEDSPPAEPMPGVPVMQGTFTIVTNGDILANNTDEGPSDSAAGKVLRWDVTPATKAAPTALIKLGE